MTIARLLPGVPAIRDALDRVIGPTPIDPVARDNGDIQWTLDRIKQRIEDVALFDAYHRGDHRIAFVTDKWRSQFGRLIKALNANYCPRVINAMVDRLRLADVIVYRAGEPNPDATQVLIDSFRDNRFDRRAGMMHSLSARHGEAFLLIWPHPDTGRPAYYPHTADRMVARYDPDRPGEIAVAAKVWMEGRRCRVTLYYPEQVERWATRSTYSGIPVSAKGFVPFDEDGEAAVFPNPYGRVPVVPFLNDTTDGMTGKSELVDVIPVQDLANKALADEFVAMEFAGFPQRWATGLLGDEKDPVTGQPIYPFTAGVERLFTSESNETAFGQFQAADLTQFVAVIGDVRSMLAQVSGTPLHYLLLTGEFPSGEALHVADAPLRAKLLDREDEHGTSWEDVALLTMLVANEATPESIDDYTAEASWRDTSPHGDIERAAYAQAVRDLGGSEAEGFRIIGWDEAKIEQVRQERLEEGATAFDAGDGEGGGEAAVAERVGPNE